MAASARRLKFDHQPKTRISGPEIGAKNPDIDVEANVADADPHTASTILYLQRTIGNHATTHMVQSGAAGRLTRLTPRIQREGGDMTKIYQIANELAPGDMHGSANLVAVLQQFSGTLVRQVYALMPNEFQTRERAFRIMSIAEETDFSPAEMHQVYVAFPGVFDNRRVAVALMNFLLRNGGTQSIAQYALANHPNNYAAMRRTLTALLPLCQIAPLVNFTTVQLDLITGLMHDFGSQPVLDIYTHIPQAFDGRRRASVLVRCITESGFNATQIQQTHTVLPACFINVPYATVVLKFMHQSGGTVSVARYGLNLFPDNVAGLDKLLTLLVPLCQVASGTDFTFPQLDIVVKYADIWTGNTFVLVRLKDVVISKPSDEAVQFLDRTKSYGFDQAFIDVSEQESDDYSQQVGQQELKRIDNQEKVDVESTLKNWPNPPQKEMDKFKKKLKAKAPEGVAKWKQEQAQGTIDLINQSAQQARINVGQQLVPNEKAQKQQQYHGYYVSSRYHPRAMDALRLTHYDFTLAGQIMTLVNTNPKLIPMLLDSKFDPTQLTRCVGVPVVELGNLITIVDISQFSLYCGTNNRLRLLRALAAGGVTASKCQALSAKLDIFNPCINDQAETGHMVTLLQQIEVVDVESLVRAFPEEDLITVGKMADVLSLLGHGSVNALVAGFNICTELEWNRVIALQMMAKVGNGLTTKQLKEELFAEILSQHKRATDFKRWMKNVGFLMSKNYIQLSYGNNRYINDNLYSIEIWVEYTDGTLVNDSTFYAHTHPLAGVAIPGQTGNSRGHFKPTDDGTNIRLKAGEFPDHIRLVLPDDVRKYLAK